VDTSYQQIKLRQIKLVPAKVEAEPQADLIRRESKLTLTDLAVKPKPEEKKKAEAQTIQTLF